MLGSAEVCHGVDLGLSGSADSSLWWCGDLLIEMLMWGAAKWCLWLCFITVNVGSCWLRFMMVCWCGDHLIEVYDGVLMWGSFDWGLWWCADVGICWWGFMMVCWCGDPLVEVYDGVLMWGSAGWGLWWCVDVGICWLRFVMVLGSAHHYDSLIFDFNLYTSTCIQISFFAEQSPPSTGLDWQVALRLSASHPWPSPADPWPSTLTDTTCTAAWYWH